MRKNLSVSIPEELFTRLSDYADEMYMSKSQVLCNCFVEIMKQKEAIKAMKALSSALIKVSENGSISDDDRAQITKCMEFINYAKGWDI